MRTTKPISTISFNSPDYLKHKLNELLKSGRLSFWAFVLHKPEDDEAGNKEHCHVYVEPSKMLQTDDLRAELREYDPERPDKPKGCLKWTSSKFEHWYMYGLHDKRYLASKSQSRRYHYSHDDFVASDDDDLLAMSRSIDLMSLSPYADMLDAIEHGIEWPEYFKRGTVPLPQLQQFQNAFHLLQSTATFRNGRETHSPKVDTETGEVVEESVPSVKGTSDTENATTFTALDDIGDLPFD